MGNTGLISRLAGAGLTLAACVTVGGGNQDAAVTGSAGSAGREGSVELTRCTEPIATVAMSGQNVNEHALVLYQLSSPLPVMRLIMQQSNCVKVVHRDVVLGAMRTERELAKAGELKEGSSFSGGQLVAADFTILPEVLFVEDNAGGIGAAFATFGSFFGMPGAILGAAAAGVRFKEAQVLLTLVDNRTGEQIAVASGSASGTDFGGLGAGVGGLTALGGGYAQTNEGKVVMGAMVHSFNNLVPHLSAARPAAKTKAGG